MVSLAVQRLDRFRSACERRFAAGSAHNAAYRILAGNTNLLPISRCQMSSAESPIVVVLFVPHLSIRCTNAILASNGRMLRAMM